MISITSFENCGIKALTPLQLGMSLGIRPTATTQGWWPAFLFPVPTSSGVNPLSCIRSKQKRVGWLQQGITSALGNKQCKHFKVSGAIHALSVSNDSSTKGIRFRDSTSKTVFSHSIVLGGADVWLRPRGDAERPIPYDFYYSRWSGYTLYITHGQNGYSKPKGVYTWNNYVETTYIINFEYDTSKRVWTRSSVYRDQVIYDDDAYRNYPGFPLIKDNLVSPYLPSTAIGGISITPYGGRLVTDRFLKRSLNRLELALTTRLPELSACDRKCMLGDLCQEAANELLYVDINSVAFLNDLRKVKELFLSIRALLKGKASAKNLASLYLSVKYGVLTMFSDVKELEEAIKRLDKRSKRFITGRAQSKINYVGSTFMLAERKFNTKIYVEDAANEFMEPIRKLIEWDFFPTLQNVWDVVPYSFVVDWFVDIESALQAIDTNTYFSTLPLLEVIQTEKQTMRLAPADIADLVGLSSSQCDVSLYDRDVVYELTPPQVRVTTGSPTNHLVDLFAIIIQRIGK